MTWTKLADGLPRHPKIVGLSDAAFRLHIYALCYSSEQLTDGEIPDAALSTLAPKRARKLVEELTNAGVWHDENHDCDACPPLVPGRFYLHGFLEYNPSADEVEDGRSKRSDKARRAARARWGQPKTPPPDNASSNATGTPPGIGRAETTRMLHDAPSRPVPSRTDNSSPHRSHDAPTQPVENDDDEKHLARCVLERIADTRMARQPSIKDRARYRATVLAELHDQHESRLLGLIASHPLAPVDVLAGAIEGEPNSLHLYRSQQASA